MAKKVRTKKKISISVFFPCYNDADSIALMVKNAQKILKKLTNNFEIIVIDDGSKDESRQILKLLSEEIPQLKLVFHKTNKGYGGALRSGFKTASKELVFYTDGDGQYDVTELACLIPKMSAGIDVVQGYKLKRHDPWYRLIIGTFYHHFSKIVFNLKVKDIDCDFRLIRKKALDSISLTYNSGVICVEMVKKLQNQGSKFVEIGVHHYPRLHGQSQFFNYRRISKTLRELFKLWWKLIILKQYEN